MGIFKSVILGSTQRREDEKNMRRFIGKKEKKRITQERSS